MAQDFESLSAAGSSDHHAGSSDPNALSDDEILDPYLPSCFFFFQPWRANYLSGSVQDLEGFIFSDLPSPLPDVCDASYIHMLI